MLPILFPGTLFEVPTYFLILLLAALGAIISGIYRAKAYGLKAYRAVDIGFLGFVSGLIGGRLAHILIEAPAYYWEHPIRIFYFWQGGFVLYGGLILGFIGGCLAARLLKEPVIKWMDLAAVPILVGVGIGRIGCLAGGCCYGLPTDLFWGMIFTNPLSGAPLNQSLHPTQALEILFCGIAALVLWFAFSKPPKTGGLAFVSATVAYSIFRFFVEFLRGDQERGVYGAFGISSSQIISLVVIAVALVFLWTQIRQSRSSRA